jgi:hypothetical protein
MTSRTDRERLRDVEDTLDRHIDLINGLIEKLERIEERLSALEKWKRRKFLTFEEMKK